MLLLVHNVAGAQSPEMQDVPAKGRQGWTSAYELLRDSVHRKRNIRGKIEHIKEADIKAGLSVAGEADSHDMEYRQVHRDTLTVIDLNGRPTLIMKAVRDEKTGEMVANETLDAAYVEASFRNVAERHGKVDLQFEITVPGILMDSRWQLRLTPDMYMLGDSVRLDPVVITGKGYRKAQLKGYQQYERFLSKIVSDTTAFINVRQLELFLKRNMPQVFAYKRDTSEVPDEVFYSHYGVTEALAVEHYTNKLARRANRRRMARRQEMFDRYVKAPIVTEGIRLDTVIADGGGNFRYYYTQTVNTKPDLRKVDIVLSGSIHEQDKKLYDIPEGGPLTFYISSVSSFADFTEKYLTKVIDRKVSAEASYNILFQANKSDIRKDIGDNGREMEQIRRQLASLIDDEEFDLDSITVTATASPEGSYSHNERLSRQRSESVSKYFRSWMKSYRDSLDEAGGFSIDESGRIIGRNRVDIPFKNSTYAENWKALDELVSTDANLTDAEKSHYFAQASAADPDSRESGMKKQGYYKYLKNELYPRLRTVTFDFYLHRKGMVQDTVHTTVLDMAYMEGVDAIRKRDYETAAAILAPYHDYNTAVAYICLDRNRSALEILKDCESTAQVNYMLALIYSRLGDEAMAVQHYLASCGMDPSYVHRGNLDPEISALIKTYGLNAQAGQDSY